MNLEAQSPGDGNRGDAEINRAEVSNASIPSPADIPRVAYLIRRPGPDRRWRIYIGLEPVARAVGRCMLESLTPEIVTVRLDVIGIGVDLVGGDQP